MTQLDAKPPPTEAEVLAALAAYRAHILDQNYQIIIQDIIPELQAQEHEEDDDPEIDIETMRVEYLTSHVCYPAEATPRVYSVAEFVERWDEIAPQCYFLDGATAGLHARLIAEKDSSGREKKREDVVAAYKAKIMEQLEEATGGVCPTGEAWAFPADWDVVIRHADGLVGPGWEVMRERSERMQFWHGLGDRGGPVRAGDDLTTNCWLDSMLEDYEVAAGWDQGSGNECCNCIVFSRPRGNKARGWSWRYVTQLGGYSGFQHEVFDDVVGLLNWYKDWDEPQDSEKSITENGWREW